MVTQLLQTGLSHPLLLVARGHLFYDHGCILTLLQRLLFRSWVLQGSWGEGFIHRRGELSRQTRVGRGGEVIIINSTAPSFPTLCMWKVKSRPLCHIHIRRVKVLQPLIRGLLGGRGSGLLHIKHGVRIGVQTPIFQSMNGIFKLVVLARHHDPSIQNVGVSRARLSLRRSGEARGAGVLSGYHTRLLLLLLHEGMPCIDPWLHSHGHLPAISKAFIKHSMLWLLGLWWWLVSLRHALHTRSPWHTMIPGEISTRNWPSWPKMG